MPKQIDEYGYNDDPLYRDEILKGLRGVGVDSGGDLGQMPAPNEPPTDEMPVITPGYPDDPPTGPINDWPDPIPDYTPGGTTPAPGTGTTTPAPVTPGPSPVAPAAPTFSDTVKNRLLELISQNPNDVSIDDPSLAPASAAFRRAQERTVARQREAAAERANAQGLSGGSGSLDAYGERAIQASGNEQAGYDAGLVINELTRRKDQLDNMLKISAGVLTADQDAQIRLAISNISAEIERAKIEEARYAGDENRSLNWDIALLNNGA